jgi:hypothetical protein
MINKDNTKMIPLICAAVVNISFHFFPVFTPDFNIENLTLMMSSTFLGVMVIAKFIDL